MPGREAIAKRGRPPVVAAAPSTSYLVIDHGGGPLATSGEFESILRAGRSLSRAVAVLGLPSGVLLAAIVHGAAVDPRAGERAAAAWRRTHSATVPQSIRGNGAHESNVEQTSQTPARAPVAGTTPAALAAIRTPQTPAPAAASAREQHRRALRPGDGPTPARSRVRVSMGGGGAGDSAVRRVEADARIVSTPAAARALGLTVDAVRSLGLRVVRRGVGPHGCFYFALADVLRVARERGRADVEIASMPADSMSVADVAGVLGLARRSVRWMIGAGKIAPVGPADPDLYFARADVERIERERAAKRAGGSGGPGRPKRDGSAHAA